MLYVHAASLPSAHKHFVRSMLNALSTVETRVGVFIEHQIGETPVQWRIEAFF